MDITHVNLLFLLQCVWIVYFEPKFGVESEFGEGIYQMLCLGKILEEILNFRGIFSQNLRGKNFSSKFFLNR